MSALIRRFERNTTGRDLIVGDIHGHFSQIEEALASLQFNPETDRLFSVGDLVDRGPECPAALQWIEKPWFHAVQGNHEDMAIRFGKRDCQMDVGIYVANGGGWNVANTFEERAEISHALATLPIALEIETEGGLVGVVHADCPTMTWHEFAEVLRTGWVRTKQGEMRNSRTALSGVIDVAMWNRARIENRYMDGVPDVRAVVVGHTPLRQVEVLGNVYHIDTAGWLPNGTGFTFLDAATLKCVTIPRAHRGALSWAAE